MTTVEAVYQNGVFKPLEQISLPENERVRLQYEPTGTGSVKAWREEARELRQRLADAHGIFPDSTLDIAEDRRR